MTETKKVNLELEIDTSTVDSSKNRYQGYGPAKCTWFPGTTEKNPHTTVPSNKNSKIIT